jgi:hypothetical protein
MGVGSHYSMNRIDYNKHAATLEDIGVTDEDAQVQPYDVDAWDIEDFVEAWLVNQDQTEWKDFYLGMASSCYRATGSIVPPLKLQARLRTCARHLTDLGAVVPDYPERPHIIRKSLEDVMKGRLSGMLTGSVD